MKIRLKKLLQIPTNKMDKYIELFFNTYLSKTHILHKSKSKVKEENWILIALNKEPKLTLVAHMDTVNEYNKSPKNKDIQIINKKVELKTTAKDLKCLGGDDRAGIYAILKCVKKLLRNNEEINFDIFFPSGEEVGLKGTNNFLKDRPYYTVPFMLEFDRRGKDVVFYQTKNKEFIRLITEAFNKKEGTGSSSDIAAFQYDKKINSANVSVGYNLEHTKFESINLGVLNRTIRKLYKLLIDNNTLNQLGNLVWKEEVVVKKTYYPRYGKTDWDWDLNDNFVDDAEEYEDYYTRWHKKNGNKC